MELVEVTITAPQVVTARYGTLSNGDLLRTDAAFAKHLVEDCAAAKYVPLAAPSPPPEAKPETTPVKPARKLRKES